jgi:phage terminase large subunit-like protein
LLAALGMYHLLGDKEPGAHVISAARDFPQAFLTLDTGKKYVENHAKLSKACENMQYMIKGPHGARWTVMSGTAEGKHGFRPSCLLLDEAHEWPNALLYNNLTANTPKRLQPFTWVATNAGQNRSCFAWQLHERALAVMNRRPGASKTLLPVIFETPEHIQWDTEEAAKAANPSLGQIVQFDALAGELEKARESNDGEARYRRLYLSQWQKTGGGRWLNLDDFDACCVPFNISSRIGDPMYVGIDMSRGDDLCSVVYAWPTPTKLYMAADFWLPRSKAEHYQARNGVPYLDWAKDSHIHLLDEDTIDKDVQIRIADHVLTRTSKQQIKAACYDRAYVGHTIAHLESKGVTCVPVGQGWKLGPGCDELERRLKERSTQIVPNPVYRFCAENCEVTGDNHGNIWPVKPNAKDKYAGKRAAKIDGIVATVTMLTEARKHDFPKANDEWKGQVISL